VDADPAHLLMVATTSADDEVVGTLQLSVVRASPAPALCADRWKASAWRRATGAAVRAPR
jgi:hypothetical protein